jgi:hypothetical protein
LAAGGESNPALDLSDTAPIGNAVDEAIRLVLLGKDNRDEAMKILKTNMIDKISQWRELTLEERKEFPIGLRKALDKLLGPGLCPAVYACHVGCVTYCLVCVSSAGSEDLW